jgi:D-glycero-alpha-D-manno-heptose-7-phosphate kinase
MIISRAPLRMSFVGGGSDLPSYYRQHGGAVLSTAIDKYVYVSVNRKFDDGIRLAYSRVEEVERLDQIEHRLLRATFELLGATGGVEVTTTADIPSRGTGLGSSSSFTVALIHAMEAYLGRHASASDLAERSCHVEIELCREPIGKQDQYAAAFGGFNVIEFRPDGSVNVVPVVLPRERLQMLEESCLVFYTGITRSASNILAEQDKAVATQADKQAVMKRMVSLVSVAHNALSSGDLDGFGRLLDENWKLKRTLASGISTGFIDDIYEAGIKAGALGGKLLGAGAGGFMLFYAPQEAHEAIMRSVRLRRCVFRFEPLGSRILFYNP